MFRCRNFSSRFVRVVKEIDLKSIARVRVGSNPAGDENSLPACTKNKENGNFELEVVTQQVIPSRTLSVFVLIYKYLLMHSRVRLARTTT